MSVVLAFAFLASVAFFQIELPSSLFGKLAHDQLGLSPLLPWLNVRHPWFFLISLLIFVLL